MSMSKSKKKKIVAKDQTGVDTLRFARKIYLRIAFRNILIQLLTPGAILILAVLGGLMLLWDGWSLLAWLLLLTGTVTFGIITKGLWSGINEDIQVIRAWINPIH